MAKQDVVENASIAAYRCVAIRFFLYKKLNKIKLLYIFKKKMEHPLYIVDVNVLLAAGTIGTLLLLSCLCCCTTEQKDNPLVIAEKNAKLAFMLMLILLENKDDNRRYIKMAEGIGYDHIISSREFIESDSE
jgi:hypothetical protein